MPPVFSIFRTFLSAMLVMVFQLSASAVLAQSTQSQNPTAVITSKIDPAAIPPNAQAVATPSLLVVNLRKQALEVLALYQAGSPASSFPMPNKDLGPDSGNKRFPFGWAIYKRGEEYLQLSDVHEAVVRDFNQALHGRAEPFKFQGPAAFPDGKPYGVYAADSKYSLVFPVRWLVVKAIDPPVQSVSTLHAKRPTSLDTPQSIVGLAYQQDLLESLGVFTLDDMIATGVFYNLKEVGSIHGAGENLLTRFLQNHQHKKATSKTNLLNLQRKCTDTRETFARKDCAEQLKSTFNLYGQSITKAKYLSVIGSAFTTWDDTRKRIDIQRINYRFGNESGNVCLKDAICLGLGSYGPAGNNLICYHLDKSIPNQMYIPLTDTQARTLSESAGGIDQLRTVSAFLQVTGPIKLLSGPKMCTERSNNKILAEGTATIKQMVLWSSNKAEYVHPLVDGKAVSSATVRINDAIKPLATVSTHKPSGSTTAKPELQTK